MRQVPRWFVTALAIFLGSGFLSPLIQANWQKWAEQTGNDQFLVKYAGPAMSWLPEATQSTWFPFITGFFIGGACFLWADYFLRRRSRAATTTITNVTPGELAHGLYLEKMHVGVDKIQKNIQIGFVLRNATNHPIRYEVQRITAIVEGKTIMNPNFSNRGGIIAKGANSTFLFSPISHIIGRKIAKSQASILYQYGHAMPDAGFVREATYTTDLTIGPHGNAYTILEENDGAI